MLRTTTTTTTTTGQLPLPLLSLRLASTPALLLLLLLVLPGSVSGLAVYDNTVRCQSHPNPSESLDVCVGSFEYYYIPDWLGESNTGYWWHYNFVEEGDETSSENGIGEQVFVKLELDSSRCSIGLGGGYPSSSSSQMCQSCEYCGPAGNGPDERSNGRFNADCTNLPGGRKIESCESTFPFFYAVDWYSDGYLNQGSTSVPSDTMAPSDQDSYEASDSPSSNDSDSKDSDSKDSNESKDSNDSIDVKTFDSNQNDNEKPKTMPTSDDTTTTTTTTIQGKNCVELIQNGGFESGSLSPNWMTQVDTDENCIIGLNDGSTAPFPNVPFVFTSAQPPINGNWDVFTQQQNPGMCQMKQVVSLPGNNIVEATLSWKDRIFSYGGFVDPGTEARVRVCLCDHDHDITTSDDLFEVWSTDPGDTTIQEGPNTRSFDVTDFIKQGGMSSVDIIFEQQEDFNFFNMYWDEISLVVCTDDDDDSNSYYYRYQSEMTLTMDVSSDRTISNLDAAIVLVKYKDFLQQQQEEVLVGGSIDSIDLVFQSHQSNNTVVGSDGATTAGTTVLIQFVTKLQMKDDKMTKRQVATLLANEVNWSDFIVNYLRKTEGGAFKRTKKVHLKLVGEEGGVGRLRRKLLFEVSSDGSSN